MIAHFSSALRLNKVVRRLGGSVLVTPAAHDELA